MPGENALAYLSGASLKKEISLVRLTPGVLLGLLPPDRRRIVAQRWKLGLFGEHAFGPVDRLLAVADG
jgi:hypothetical protein